MKDGALGTCTEAYRQVATEFELAQSDPRRSARMPWTRRTAEARFWRAGEELASWRTGSRFSALLREAVGRAVAHRDPATEPWRRASVRQVRRELETLGSKFTATDDSILKAIFPEGALTEKRSERALVAELVQRMSRDKFEAAVAAASFIERPHRRGERNADDAESAMAQFINGEACRTPRPVTVWRGELPFEGNKQLSRRLMLGAPTGTVITRSATAMSATWEPAVAGRVEFCGSACAREDIDPSGWVLEIRTQHVFDVSTRDKILGRADGLADDEHEALIVVPRLRIEGRREALVHGAHCTKRIVVVECVAL